MLFPLHIKQDWQWGDQDGGLGGVGTAILDGSSDGCVRVIWDNGNSNKYRIGYEDKHDLRMLDTSPAGTMCLLYLYSDLCFI